MGMFYFWKKEKEENENKNGRVESALVWKLINAMKEKNEWPDDPRHCQDVKLLRWEFHGFSTAVANNVPIVSLI